MSLSKSDICDDPSSNCKVVLYGLEADTQYELSVQNSVGQILSTKQSLTFATPPATANSASIFVTESTVEVIMPQNDLPFSDVSNVNEFFIVVSQFGVSEIGAMKTNDFKTWAQFRDENGGDRVYQTTSNLGYPTSQSDNVDVSGDQYSFQIGMQSFQQCSSIAVNNYCDGPLTPSTLYQVWFVAKSPNPTFSIAPIGQVVTSDLTSSAAISQTGPTSVAIKFTDNIHSPETDYIINVQSAANRMRRSTNQISKPRSEVCDVSGSNCVMYIHGLIPSTVYNVDIRVDLNGYSKIVSEDVSVATSSFSEAAEVVELSETSIALNLSLPFLADPSIDTLTILIGVETDQLVTSTSFKNWADVLGGESANSSEITGVYQVFPNLDYSNLPDGTNIQVDTTNMEISLVLGETLKSDCENVNFCNGELLQDKNYYLWFLGQVSGGSDLLESGPFGPFETLSSEESSGDNTLTAGVGLIMFVVLLVLFIILAVLLVIYWLRHGRRSRRRRVPAELNPVLVAAVDPSPVSTRSGNVDFLRDQRSSTQGSDEPDGINIMSILPPEGFRSPKPEEELEVQFARNPVAQQAEQTSTDMVRITAAPTHSRSGGIPRLKTELLRPHFQTHPIDSRRDPEITPI